MFRLLALASSRLSSPGLAAATLAACVAAGASACTVKSTESGSARPTGDAGSTSAASKQAPKSKPKTSSFKGLRGATPPSGATSKGKQTRPSAGALSVPIENVEVYVVAVDALGTGTQDVSWAHVDNGPTYVWLTSPMTCADGTVDPSGAFVAGVNDDGSGTYLFSLGNCPSSDLFGCDFDTNGTETACGACAVDGDTIACVAAQ